MPGTAPGASPRARPRRRPPRPSPSRSSSVRSTAERNRRRASPRGARPRTCPRSRAPPRGGDWAGSRPRHHPGQRRQRGTRCGEGCSRRETATTRNDDRRPASAALPDRARSTIAAPRAPHPSGGRPGPAPASLVATGTFRGRSLHRATGSRGIDRSSTPCTCRGARDSESLRGACSFARGGPSRRRTVAPRARANAASCCGGRRSRRRRARSRVESGAMEHRFDRTPAADTLWMSRPGLDLTWRDGLPGRAGRQ
jgi:hypothetical protein